VPALCESYDKFNYIFNHKFVDKIDKISTKIIKNNDIFKTTTKYSSAAAENYNSININTATTATPATPSTYSSLSPSTALAVAISSLEALIRGLLKCN